MIKKMMVVVVVVMMMMRSDERDDSGCQYPLCKWFVYVMVKDKPSHRDVEPPHHQHHRDEERPFSLPYDHHPKHPHHLRSHHRHLHHLHRHLHRQYYSLHQRHHHYCIVSIIIASLLFKLVIFTSLTTLMVYHGYHLTCRLLVGS